MSVSAYLNYFPATRELQKSELIQRSVFLSTWIIHTKVTVQASLATSLQDSIRQQFAEHMPPVKIAYTFNEERSDRNPITINGVLTLTTPNRQLKFELSFNSGSSHDTVQKSLEAYRLNGNQQMMNILQILLALDLSVDARQEIIDIYFEYVMGYTRAQLGKV
jgi:hypothetical protein